jgi:hypothetical protein
VWLFCALVSRGSRIGPRIQQARAAAGDLPSQFPGQCCCTVSCSAARHRRGRTCHLRGLPLSELELSGVPDQDRDLDPVGGAELGEDVRNVGL